MNRVLLIDPFNCTIGHVLMHTEHLLDRQVYRYVRGAPLQRIVLYNGDVAWYARHEVNVCHFAMPSLVGNIAIGGRCVVTGPGIDCATTIDELDAAVLWLAGPAL